MGTTKSRDRGVETKVSQALINLMVLEARLYVFVDTFYPLRLVNPFFHIFVIQIFETIVGLAGAEFFISL
jgi:hypothetical protein